jgi:hypothetical protein
MSDGKRIEPVNALLKNWHLTDKELDQALRNIGLVISSSEARLAQLDRLAKSPFFQCGACAEIFYTGFTTGRHINSKPSGTGTYITCKASNQRSINVCCTG